jgi:predicted ribosome quality control (RQC) complex YloA/Tae2 family protein
MESFTLAFLVEELQERLSNCFLEKVQQVSQTQLVFKFSRGRLLISPEDQHPTLYLLHTSGKRAARAPTPFVLLAQKHLAGGRLEELQQVDYDRIIRFRFASVDEAGNIHRSSLIAELITRRANLYLLDAEDHIIERFIRRESERLWPGERYTDPQQAGRIDPSEVSESQFEPLVSRAPSLHHALIQTVKGFSPTLAREVVWRARQASAYAAYRSVILELLTDKPQPYIYAPAPLDRIRPGEVDWEKQIILSPIYLHWPTEEAGFRPTPFANMVEALEAYEQLIEVIRTFQAHKRELVTTLRQHIKKTQKRRGRLDEDMTRLGDYERDRRFGELLLANLHQAERRSGGFLVTDYFDPEQRRIEIPAEPRLTALQAANSYFEHYRKSKRKSEALIHQRADLDQELARLDEATKLLDAALIPDDLGALAEEILGHPLDQSNQAPAPAKLDKIPGVYRFQSSEQHEIWVGRSAEANQRLTFKLARPHDIWLHTADYPGSHVVLRKAKGEPIPFRSLIEAAELAAFFSQARQAAKVVVNYTERKYVYKIPGAAPGLVRLADFKSMTVEPRVQATRIDG